MNYDYEKLRQIDLVAAIELCGATYDKKKQVWRLQNKDAVSINGTRFYNQTKKFGRGGALDLVQHVMQCSLTEAAAILSNTAAPLPTAQKTERTESRRTAQKEFSKPMPCPRHLAAVKRYLTAHRCLDADIIDMLIQKHVVYADERCNAVFLSANAAELQGTGISSFKGLAAGSKKSGGFTVGCDIRTADRVAVCESAIKSIALYQIRDDAQLCCVSSAGTPIASFYRNLLSVVRDDAELIAAFDNDEAGHEFTENMIQCCSGRNVERWTSSAKDWDEDLRSQSQCELCF